MREIKFRAWYHGGGDPRVSEEMKFSVPFPVMFWSNIEDWPFAVELMQYTGLKDKNGTEIYEFDVIKSCRTGLNYKVVWDDASAAFTALCTNLEKDYYIGPYSWADTEIIGNIHESPELKEK